MTVNETPSAEFVQAFAGHRAELLRHCYRMLGSFADAEDLVQDTFLKAWRARATYAADAPISHWLMRVATNACLNALSRGGRRQLPQLDYGCADENTQLERLEPAMWVTPAPDAALFRSPEEALETREAVAVAFIALLQRLPPRQRAVLLLKDVVGWPSEEIAAALELTVSSVSSALHRARETIAEQPQGKAEEPAPEVLNDYIRCWEERDLVRLVARLRKDVVFSMPPLRRLVLRVGSRGRVLAAASLRINLGQRASGDAHPCKRIARHHLVRVRTGWRVPPSLHPDDALCRGPTRGSRQFHW
jgi:RNA polymerase sigma-70 factor, ECF subfamily